MKFLIWIFILIYTFSAVSKRSMSLQNSRLKQDYLNVLNQASVFYKLTNKKQNIKKEIKKTKKLIDKLRNRIEQASSLPIQHKIHSYKLLNSIKKQLVIMQFNTQSNAFSEIKRKKKFFNTFFELAQVYNLKQDMKHKIFYCAKDKSLWIQESNVAKNIINSSLKNCGQKIK